MKLILSLVFMPLFAVSAVAQTLFYLEEPFKHTIEIPGRLLPLLRDEIKQACGSEAISGETVMSKDYQLR
jgi:hypothetical protein